MPVDPICGMFVRDGPAALRAEVEGHDYAFCSKGCLRRFTAPDREARWLRRSAAFALASGALLLLLPQLNVLREAQLGWALLGLGTAVQVLAGWPFYQGIGHAIAARSPNADTLVALATTAAWAFGAVEVLAPDALVPGRQVTYFEVAALVLGLLAVGRAVEQRMRGRANLEVGRLLKLQPAKARLLRDGHELEVPVEELEPDSVVLVRAGERIPADGVVVQGRSAVDEKLLTGESVPVDKRPGHRVLGGSVNKEGPLQVKISHVGASSALAHVVALIGQAQTSAPRGERFADTLSAWLVPGAVLLGLAAFAFWLAMGAGLPFAFSALVAVLLVACPCALGLATPAALAVGVAKGTREGILVKDAEVLERVQRVTIVVFDKTGTLTKGEPTLTDVLALDGLEEPEVLALAASAEQRSDHPLGKAIVRAAQERRLATHEPKGFQNFAGVGVEARVGRDEVLVGSARLLKDRKVPLQEAEQRVRALQDAGKTVVLVARNDRLVGVIALADPLKPEAVATVQSLKGLGLDVGLMTGDTTRTAEAVGRALGIRRVFAEVTPHGKSGIVKALQDGGRVVAMVGDGVNDAPALAAADVGIAVGEGSEIALGAADLVLLKNDARDIPAAIQLSRATFEKVKQNVYWASAYNLALLPVAALGLLNPVLAGAAMAFSTVPVLANSLRMKRQAEAPPKPEPAPLPRVAVAGLSVPPPR
jgi:Cu+-exporting ATPase